MTYKQRIFLSFIVLFSLCAGLIMMLILHAHNHFIWENSESRQAVYAEMVADYVESNRLEPGDLTQLSNLIVLFPPNIQIDILDHTGNLLFESQPKSNVSNQGAYYLPKDDYLIRVASPEEFGENVSGNYYRIYILFIFFLLIIILSCFLYAYQKYYQSFKNLKYFISYFSHHNRFPSNISFKDDDLHQIQCLLQDIYTQIQQREKQITKEREKLIDHFHYAEEGISVFTPDRQNIYTNSHFIQYLNLLLHTVTFDVSILFQSEIFDEIVRFLQDPAGKNNFQTKRHTNNHIFLIQIVIFDDQCFEIIIRDTTHEKDNFNQSEIANNVAHELFTPVTSIRGYIETLIEHQKLSEEKRREYLQRTYKQIIRLSEIIQDTVLLSRATTTPHSFLMEDINFYDLLQYLTQEEDREMIAIHKATIQIQINKQATIKGNRTLLSSIFLNLGHNAIKYGGEHCIITIQQYMEDENFYYFSFADNGPGVEEKMLDRIFERFYRISEGRTREKGGSGLGLTIVKEAVIFHHGQISARNRVGGGLEFLFTLRKY
ncbi:MAG: HAMP domain-containing histidine kinase [Dysgonamonadaceae bacterium]|nr:HAMP domain-containing histidine kinase [Dysgonamonadaceae bacterium]